MIKQKSTSGAGHQHTAIYTPLSISKRSNHLPISRMNQFNQQKYDEWLINQAYTQKLKSQIQEKQQQRIMEKSNSRFIQQMYIESAVSSFPFGKDRIKIAKYVAEQMNQDSDRQKAEILNKFRLEAIQFRNNRHFLHHKNSKPFITQSMLPNSIGNNQIRRYTESMAQPKRNQFFNSNIHQNMQTLQPIARQRVKTQNSQIILNKDDLMIQHFRKDTPKQKHKKKIKSKTIVVKEKDQDIYYKKISSFLKEINAKLDQNKNLLSSSKMISNNQEQKYNSYSHNTPRKRINLEDDFEKKTTLFKKLQKKFIQKTEQIQQRFKGRSPKVVYTKDGSIIRQSFSENIKDMQKVKENLQLLKRNSKILRFASKKSQIRDHL